MAREKQSVLDEINKELNQAENKTPDFVEIEGVKYFRDRVQAQDPNRKTKKLWTNPRRPADPPIEVELEQVAINVAPYADRIVLDSVIYLAGRVYEVPLAQAATIREICSRTWQHEASTGGAYSNGQGSVRGSVSQSGVMAPGINFG